MTRKKQQYHIQEESSLDAAAFQAEVRALKNLLRQQQNLVNSLPFGLVLIDRNRTILSTNDTFVQMVEPVHQNLRAQTLDDYLDSASSRHLQESCLKLHQDIQESCKAPLTFITGTGQNITRLVQIMAEKHAPDNEPRFICHIYPQFYAATDSLRCDCPLQTFFAQADDRLAIYDENLNLITANPAYRHNASQPKAGTAPDANNDPIQRLLQQVRDSGQDILSIELLQSANKNAEFESVRVFKTEHGFGVLTRDVTPQKRSESRLRQSEQQLRAILETAIEGIITVDQDGIIHNFNSAASHLFGYEPQEVIGKNVSLLMPEPFAQEHDQHIRRYLETGQRRVVGKGRELVAQRRDGSIFPIFLSISEMIVDGEHKYFTSIVRDITERKKIENALRISEDKFRTLAETTAAGITITRRQKILYANPAFEKISGYTKLELMQMNASDIVHPDDRELVFQRSRDLFQDKEKSSHFELKIICKDGTKRWLELSTGLIDYGKKLAAITTFFDITNRKETAFALQTAKETAEAATAARTEFLANVTHELRTPLNGIIGYAELLSGDKALPASLKSTTQSIIRSSSHLQTMINDILSLTRIDAGKEALQLEDFFLADFLMSIMDFAQSLASENGLLFTGDFSPLLPRAIRADKLRLRQILVKLLGNAFKFTNQGGVTLTVDGWPVADAAGDDLKRMTFRFQVIDSGIGVPPDCLEKIFQPFFQVESKLSAKNKGLAEGTGLGLTLCQRQANLMGSKIQLESSIGGTRFWFDVDVDVIDPRQMEDDVNAPLVLQSKPLLMPVSPDSDEGDYRESNPCPPPNYLSQLKQAAEIGDISEVKALLQSGEEAHPNCELFFAKVKTMTDKYMLREITDFAVQMLQQH